MQKPEKTFADYLVVAISPVLIMVLVGSLAFFLIQVFYRAEAIEGVRWVLFWFVLAIVLVARIGIEQSKEHAAFYGVVLAAVTWIYFVHTHTAPMFGIILLAVTWWCAHKLTVDCTLINDEEDTSGVSVLEGLSRALEKSLLAPGLPPLPPTPLPKLPGGIALPPRPRPVRAPGRWVIYFSLAALPLFGIGQLLLPAESRRIGFEFLAVYLAAALSLLITTSFLGMRRYLRQRFVEMSTGIAVGWVRFGVLLAVAVLILAMVLPRPGANSIRKHLTYQVSYKKHPASDYALPFNPPGEGKGTPSDHPNEQPRTGTDSRKAASGSGTQSAPNTSNQGNQSNSHNESSHSGGGGGGSGGGGGGSGNSAPPEGSATPPKADLSANGAESDGGNGSVKANDDGKEPQPGNGNGSPEPGKSGNGSQAKKTPEQKQTVASPRQTPIEQPQKTPQTPERRHLDFQRLLRILVFIALAALFVWVVIRYRRAIAQAIRAFIAAVRDFFRELFSFRRRKPAPTARAPVPAPVLRPFATYENPFLTGKDKSWPPERLILYTYDAIRAWGKEQRIELKPQETPREFCARLAGRFPEFGPELNRFSVFCGYAAFARQLPDDFDPEPIHRLWQYLGDSVMAVSSH